MDKLRRMLLYRNPGRFLGSRKEWIHFAALIVVLLPLSEWLGRNLLFEPPTKWYQDFQVRRRAKQQEKWTRVVRIDQEDHEKLFGGVSPLPAAAILQAACALAARQPAVVVVDLDTSLISLPHDFHLPESAVPIVWAVDTEWQSEGGRLVQKADPALAGRAAKQPLYGIATLPVDFDGVVRGWRRSEQVDGYPRPTLPWAAVKAFCEGHPSLCPSDKTESIEDSEPSIFRNDVLFLPLKLSEFLTQTSAKLPDSCDPQNPDPRLKDRIVILGGSYSRADVHRTAWGSRNGSDLVAMAVESAFEPELPSRVGKYLSVALELLIAISIVAIHHWVRPIPATLVTLGLLPLGGLISAEMLFVLRDQAVGIVPFMVGLLIHQLVGSATRAQTLVAECEEREEKGMQASHGKRAIE